jgi:hypothetical protein
MNNVKIEQDEVTKLLGKKSVHNKELLCFFNNTVNKAGPTGSSLVAPGLLFSHVTLKCTRRANVNEMHVNLMAQSGGDIDFITTCFCKKC